MLIARLQGSGIAAFARDEHMVTLDWLASNAIGGVKVDVDDEDFDRALALMAAPPSAEDFPAPVGLEPRPAGSSARVSAIRLFRKEDHRIISTGGLALNL